MSARKPKRPAKAPKSRTLEAVERAHEKAMGAVKVAIDNLTPLNDEIRTHPAYRKREELAKREREAKEKEQQRAASLAFERRQAAYPVAENPLNERDLAETLHNLHCFADYVMLLELPELNMGETDNRQFGRYLLRQVLVSALEGACKQEEFERKETRAKHEAELAKAKGGAS